MQLAALYPVYKAQHIAYSLSLIYYVFWITERDTMSTKKQVGIIIAKVYSPSKIQGILDEVSRLAEASKHVENPKNPKWIIGSRNIIEESVDDYLKNSKQLVHMPNGEIRERKRNENSCCLVAGVASHPLSMSELDRTNAPSVQDWIDSNIKYLKKKFGEKLKGICLHLDESHPHIHFYVVGDAQRTHPGMKNEISGKTRISNRALRNKAHKEGLSRWLDEYHKEVGIHFGFERTLHAKPAWRIKDRAVKSKMFDLDKELSSLRAKTSASNLVAHMELDRLSAMRDDLYEKQQKIPLKLKF